jgi:hypothetical protein
MPSPATCGIDIGNSRSGRDFSQVVVLVLTVVLPCRAAFPQQLE